MRGWLIILLMLPATLLAAEPKARIAGPRIVRAGDRIRLDASESTGETFKWDLTCIPPLRDDQDPPEVSADGVTVDLQSYLHQEYHATLIVSGIDDAGKPQSDLTRWTVFVIPDAVPPPPAPRPKPTPSPEPEPPGPAPTPPDPPSPPNPPMPSEIPEGEFGISRDVRDWALGVVSPDRKAETAALAAAIAAQSTATTPQQMINEMGAGINQAIAAHPAAWQPFREKYSARVQQLAQSGRLNTMDRWHLLRSETAVGLQAAAR